MSGRCRTPWIVARVHYNRRRMANTIGSLGRLGWYLTGTKRRVQFEGTINKASERLYRHMAQDFLDFSLACRLRFQLKQSVVLSIDQQYSTNVVKTSSFKCLFPSSASCMYKFSFQGFSLISHCLLTVEEVVRKKRHQY